LSVSPIAAIKDVRISGDVNQRRDALVSAKVTMFTDSGPATDVHKQVNEFLAKHGFDVWDVQIQFVSRSGGSDQYGAGADDFMAYVTHPAD
jgi:hypothetical protein